MEILLISQKKIKAFSALNTNLDNELLNSQILVAQKIGLQTLLGTSFLDYIKNQVVTSTITPEIQTLLDDYIADYLINRGYYEALPFIYTRSVSQALIKGQSEEGQTASFQDLKLLRNIALERYQFFAQRMNDFLCNNSGDYPNYNSQNSNDGMMPDKGQNYFGGLVIPSSVSKGGPSDDSNLPNYSEPYNCK